MKTIFKILLLGAVVVLGYLCVKSILDPLSFEEESARRKQVVINRLIDIRNIQTEYRNLYGQYASTFDTLVDFVKSGHIPQVVKEGMLTEQQLASGLTEKEAVKQGLIKRDTVRVPVIDVLFGGNYKADSLGYVPGTSTMFELAVGSITTASGFEVKVFECKTPYEVYLEGLDRQEIINLKDLAKKLDRYPGLKVGSVTEINNNAGNWE